MFGEGNTLKLKTIKLHEPTTCKNSRLQEK